MQCNAVTKREHWVNDPSRVREWIISNQRSFQSRDSWCKVEGHHRHGGTMRNKSSTSQIRGRNMTTGRPLDDLAILHRCERSGMPDTRIWSWLAHRFCKTPGEWPPSIRFCRPICSYRKISPVLLLLPISQISPVLLLLRTLELSYLYGMVEALQIVASSRKKVTTSPPYHFSVSKRIFENPWLTLFGSRRCIVLSIYRLEVELDSIACHCVRGCPGIAYQRSCMPFCCGNGLPYYR